jgi:hypothetical protein
MVIAIDFDGTCVKNNFPGIGESLPCVNIIKSLILNGHKIILLTMRTGKQLDQAINWFNTNEIKLFGVNENPDQKRWSLSNKVYADLYIDDNNLGIPLSIDVINEDTKMSSDIDYRSYLELSTEYNIKQLSKKYVNWKKTEQELRNLRLL